jgi:hypothetical protein
MSLTAIYTAAKPLQIAQQAPWVVTIPDDRRETAVYEHPQATSFDLRPLARRSLAEHDDDSRKARDADADFDRRRKKGLKGQEHPPRAAGSKITSGGDAGGDVGEYSATSPPAGR